MVLLLLLLCVVRVQQLAPDAIGCRPDRCSAPERLQTSLQLLQLVQHLHGNT